MITDTRLAAHVWYWLKDIRWVIRTDPDITMLVSYPKCGATWLQFMLAEILRRRPGIQERAATVRLTELTARYSGLPRIQWTHDATEIAYENGGRPNPHRTFVYEGRWCYRHRRVVLLLRDPRDVVVSYFHQVTRRSKRPLHFDSISDFVRHPLYGFARIIRFYEIWHANRHVPRELLIIRYEDLLERGVEVLTGLLEFLGAPAAGEVVSEAYEAGRPASLRQLERAGRVDGMRTFGDQPDALKVRKARSGTYLEELSPEDIDFCNKMMLPFLAEYGYLAEDGCGSSELSEARIDVEGRTDAYLHV